MVEHLLKGLTFALNPSSRMPALRVVVSPVNNAPFFVPGVLAVKGNDIPPRQKRNSRRQVDVVGNKESLARAHLKNEALVATSVVVIGKNLDDDALALNLSAGSAGFKCSPKGAII